ncbi:MAG: outer membrane beta-barrel protein [Candidatus Omnitrophica bacterium]|nr:outer membrane beta-barrel protein [Candidatus Omnitrophota bacterium]
MKKKTLSFLVLIMFLAGTVLLPGTASAFEQGSWKLEPSFKTEEKWDSNIFYDTEDPDSDWITVLTPGIYGEWNFGQADKHKAFAGYDVDIGLFGEYTDQNYGNHNAYGGVNLDFNKMTFDANNRFQFTSSRAGTEFQRRILRKIDEANFVAGWHYNKIDFDTGYQFFITDYLSDTLDQIDFYHNKVWVTGYIQIAPKTQALLELNYKNIQYPDASGRNGNAYAALTGIKGDITAKITGVAKAGFKVKDYNSSDANDFANFIAHIDLMYDMNERVDMMFSYHREPYESTYTNNNYYTGDHFKYNLTYDIGRNFVGKFDSFFFHNAYTSPGPGENEDRTDFEWEARPRLEYHWKEWAVFGGGYTFHQRASNVYSRKYDQHVVSADVKFMF